MFQDSKVFRLFISSTFDDFKEERRVLQKEVFPEVKEYARDKGFVFQPIDLRWGVSQEAQNDQKTLHLCLREVQSCKVKPYPNFLVMLGDRYGWIPLPYAIEKDEFEKIVKNVEDTTLLNQWYSLDKNQIPSSYVLKEREGKYTNYELYKSIEDTLRDILQKAVEKTDLTPEQKEKYFTSATEAEVIEGLIPYKRETEFQKKILLANNSKLKQLDPKHTFAFLRDVELNSKKSNRYIPNEQEYKKAKNFKELVEKNIDPNNILKVSTKQVDKQTLQDSYLEKFREKVTQFLKQQIDKKQKVKQTYTEQQLHQRYKDAKLRNFMAQEATLNTINSYINGNNNEPFVLYGSSGKGKSCVMAKAIDEVKNKKVIYRFVGATPSSITSADILEGILEELGVEVGKFENFEEFSKDVRAKLQAVTDEVVIFVDAIDQLKDEKSFLWLPNILPSNLKVVISALEDENYKEDSKFFQELKEVTSNIHKIEEFAKPQELLKALLAESKRMVDETQLNYFLKQYENVKTPFYVTIASQEMKNWKSEDTTQTLSNTQKGIIREYISNLTKLYHHDEAFVKRVLGYIYASNGLSENEIITLIEEDKEFIDKVAPEEFHKNVTKELPMVHWSRLDEQLNPFLYTRVEDDEELIYFFHREFVDAISEDKQTQTDEHKSILKNTQSLILKNQHKPFSENRWGKLYITLLTNYHQHNNNSKEYALFLTKLQDSYVKDSLKVIFEKGYKYYKKNYMKEAISYQLNAYYITEELYRKDRDRWVEDYTTSLNNLASFYKSIGKTSEAIELEEQALEITRELYKKDKDRWAELYTTLLNNLALSHSSIGKTSEAIELFEQSLEITKDLYKKDRDRWVERYTKSLNNLAYSYRSIGKTSEAIELDEQSLEITKDLYKKDRDRWAEAYTRSLNNLASSYESIGKTSEAIELEEEALEIRKDLYKQDRDRWVEAYTSSLSNLALSYSSIGKASEAIKLAEQSLEIMNIDQKLCHR